MLSLVGVVTAVTSAITGAVVSVVDSSLSSLQEMIVRIKQEIRKTNKNFFIFYSIPKVKYYWIRRTQYIPELGLFYKNRGFYLEGV